MIKNKKLFVSWIIFCVWLYGAWTLCEMVLVPMIRESVSSEYISALLRDGVIKNIVWTLPALLLIRHFEQDMYVSHKQLYRFRKGSEKYLLLGIFMAAVVIISTIMRRHTLSLSPSFHPSQLIVVLFVGMSEETVFRGFLLNSMLKNADTEKKKMIAVGLNAVMFLMIHFPIWISSGTFVNNFVGMGFLTVMVLSILFSWCFIRCKSLMAAIILHSFYDMIVFLFAG